MPKCFEGVGGILNHWRRDADTLVVGEELVHCMPTTIINSIINSIINHVA